MPKLLKNKLIYSLITFSLLILGTSFTVHAENSDKGMMKDTLEERQVRQEERNQVRDDHCVQLQDRIQNRINEFNENKDGNVERYREAKQRISDLISKLENQGVDVAQLKEDLNTFDSMITKYASIYADLINSLKNTTQYVCGESQGQFKEAMDMARQKHQEVVAQRQSIHDYYKNTLKEDIQALKNARKENN